MNNVPATAKRPPNNKYAKNWILITYDSSVAEVTEILNSLEHFTNLIMSPRYYKGLQLFQIYFKNWQKLDLLNLIKPEYEWNTVTYWNYNNPKNKFTIYKDVDLLRKELLNEAKEKYEKISKDEIITDEEMNAAYDDYEEQLVINEMFEYYEKKYLKQLKKFHEQEVEEQTRHWKKNEKGYFVFED